MYNLSIIGTLVVMGATGTGKTASVMNGVGAGIFKPKFCF